MKNQKKCVRETHHSQYLPSKAGFVARMPDNQQFEENELALAKDRGKLYEAKVLKAKLCNKAWKYFVHYQGWSRKYDCWIDEKDMSKKPTDFSWKGSRMGVAVENTEAKKKVLRIFL